MTMGLVGRKCGMTRVFTEEGISIPVTVIEAQPNRITQVKTVETDGYRALQVTAGSRKASRVSKPEAGHFAAAKVEAGDLITEFRLDDADDGEFELGGELKVDLFEAGQKVDVIGTSVGNARPVRSVRTRRRAAYSRARRCPARWVTFAARSRTSKSCASIRSATFF
jgi:large subunit ribosomal protein L3